MSDPNEPTGGDPFARDAVDDAYAEAEAMLSDDAERAARRARVLGAVAAARAEPEPAPAQDASPPPASRRLARTPAPWLMAAGVAGVAALVGLRVAPSFQQRAPSSEIAPAAPSPSPAAHEAKAPPPGETPSPVVQAAPAPPTPVRPRSQPSPPEALAAPAPGDAARAPPPLPIPPVPLRVETPPPPPTAPPPMAPPPLPIPPVPRRAATADSFAAIGPAAAERQPPSPAMIDNPDWGRQPTLEDMAQYYPDRAQRTETNGSAVIECTVRGNGTLEGCIVVRETPENYGFRDAALKLARIYRMRPRTLDGVVAEGRKVRVTITFRVPS